MNNETATPAGIRLDMGEEGEGGNDDLSSANKRQEIGTLTPADLLLPRFTG